MKVSYEELSNTYIMYFVIALITIAGFALILNSFVMGRIFYQNIRKIHHSKLFFLSLATADMLFAASSLLWIFFRKSNYKIAIWVWFLGGGIPAWSSLLHVIMITVDRFIATKFPLQHKIKVTRKRVVTSILVCWLTAVVVQLPGIWAVQWYMVYAIVVILGSVFLVIAYTYIARIALRRRATLKLQRGPQQNVLERKSVNTTYLGISISVAFIVCNLPWAIMGVFNISGYAIHPLIVGIMSLLIDINTVVNPIIYTAIEYIHGVIKRRIIKEEQRAEEDLHL